MNWPCPLNRASQSPPYFADYAQNAEEFWVSRGGGGLFLQPLLMGRCSLERGLVGQGRGLTLNGSRQPLCPSFTSLSQPHPTIVPFLFHCKPVYSCSLYKSITNTASSLPSLLYFQNYLTYRVFSI